MEAAERASLNRQAAELAGWTIVTAPLGEDYRRLTICRPDGYILCQSAVLDPEEAVEWLEGHTPDVLSDPALWWPLVERFAGLLAARRGPLGSGRWEGPTYLPASKSQSRRPRWTVVYYLPGEGESGWEEATPGEAVVKAALAVAAALGLGAG